MTHFYTTIDIQAPPDRVRATVRDIEHWFEWTPTVISVRPLDPGPLAVGYRAIVRQLELVPSCWRITQLEEGHRLTWITRGPGILVTARHTVEDTAYGSRAALSLDFSRPLGPFYARLARGLKKRAEADARSRPQGMAAWEHHDEQPIQIAGRPRSSPR